MRMASASFNRAKSVVALKCRLLTNCWIFVCGMCSMYDFPAFRMFTLLGSVSNPVTRCPASAKRNANGRPTYPQPIMATFSCAPLKNSGLRSIGMSCVALLHYWGNAQARCADGAKTRKYSRVIAQCKKRRATIATLCFPDVAEQRKTRQDREHTLGVPGRQRKLLNPATRLVVFCRLRAAAAVASRFRCLWISASCGLGEQHG